MIRPSSVPWNRLPVLMMFGALAALPALTGCPGSLEGEFPPVVNGTGGNSGSSGGNSGSSGGNSGSSGGAIGSGGSGSGGAVGSGGGTATVCDAPNTVIKTSCATSDCHGGSQPPDLTASGLAARLIGVQGSVQCLPSTEKNLVDSTKPASGLLLLRIKGDTRCLEPMPPTGTLSATDQQCIVDWITAQLP